MSQELQPSRARRAHVVAVLQSVSPVQLVSLLDGARRSLDEDPDLARHYLDQLSAILENEVGEDLPERLLLPPRSANGAIRTKGGLASWQLRRVTDHIEHHLETPLSTEELAAVARLSTGHFCRAFKASMGETPHSYIIRQRLRRAQSLMIRTRDTLSQIACACGLTDQAHLTRLFRRVLGTTPLAWRRDWQRAA